MRVIFSQIYCLEQFSKQEKVKRLSSISRLNHLIESFPIAIDWIHQKTSTNVEVVHYVLKSLFSKQKNVPNISEGRGE